MQSTEFGCTMNSERRILNDATQEVYGQVRGNSDSRSERESGCTYVCGVSGVQNARRRTGKRELLYMQSGFGRWVPNRRRPGDPAAGTWDSGDQRENRESGRDVQVIPGRVKNVVYV